MRVRGEATVSGRLLAIAVELRCADAPLEIGARINARGVMPLIEDLIARAALLAAEEVVVTNLVETCRAGVGGEVSADAGVGLVCAHHHGGGVPANDVADARLHRLVAREGGLITRLDGVDVRRGDEGGEIYAKVARSREEAHQQELGALGAVGRDGALDLTDQACGLRWVGVGDLLKEVEGLHDSTRVAPHARMRVWQNRSVLF